MSADLRAGGGPGVCAETIYRRVVTAADPGPAKVRGSCCRAADDDPRNRLKAHAIPVRWAISNLSRTGRRLCQRAASQDTGKAT